LGADTSSSFDRGQTRRKDKRCSREQKTKIEVADIISAKLGGVVVNVADDWHPTVFAWGDDDNTIKLQRRAEEIARELREKFDLRT
jgi:hypothetical protein